MKTKTSVIITLAGLLIAGCEQKTVNIDVMNDEGKAVMGLDYRDFNQAASEMIQSMISAGALKKPGAADMLSLLAESLTIPCSESIPTN